ncbi:hypothetical protein IRZ70_01880 [Pseudomonas monteilii]|nr:hypothetical protein [Pseudomonas monteilii]
MTFRVEPVHDITHTCPSGHNIPDHPLDLDHDTWTCRTCRQSVLIKMGTAQGQHFSVERVSALDVREGDYLVCRVNGGHQRLKVHRLGRQAEVCELFVEQHGRLPWGATRYLNCIRADSHPLH